jgi:hypothetical protein
MNQAISSSSLPYRDLETVGPSPQSPQLCPQPGCLAAVGEFRGSREPACHSEFVRMSYRAEVGVTPTNFVQEVS